jgi:hypothetical protein
MAITHSVEESIMFRDFFLFYNIIIYSVHHKVGLGTLDPSAS